MANTVGSSPIKLSVAQTSGPQKTFQTAVAEARDLQLSTPQTQSRIMTFLTKMGEACSALVEKVREKVAVTTVASTLPSATISITTMVNSALGLFHLASSCISKALPHLGIASGVFSIVDGIRDLASSRNNHNRAKDVEAALEGVNSFLQNNDGLMKAAKDSDVQAAWTKMRDLETLKLKLETEVKTLELKPAELDAVATQAPEGTGGSNENARLLSESESKEMGLSLKFQIESLEKKITTLERDIPPELRPVLEKLRPVLEMSDLKTTLEGTVRLLEEKRLDKAIVGCFSIAVGIVGVVANAVTLGLAAPLVGAIAWGSAQAVKVCLRAYRTATSITQEDRDSGVMVLKKCYKDVYDAHSDDKDTTDLLGAKLAIMLKLKMPLPRGMSEPILVFAAAGNDAEQKPADNKQRAADETKAFKRIDKLTKQTASFDTNINDDMNWKEKTLAVGKAASRLIT